jgi:hypothetical protein
LRSNYNQTYNMNDDSDQEKSPVHPGQKSSEPTHRSMGQIDAD